MARRTQYIIIIAASIILTVFAGYYLFTAVIPPDNNMNIGSSEHPFLFFHDIADCPGYQNNGSAPWSDWEDSIMRNANDHVGASTFDAEAAADLGMAYQLTRDRKYAAASARAIQQWGSVQYSTVWIRDMDLAYYVIGYDLAQPGMTPGQDEAARDALARYANASYWDANLQGQGYINYADNLGREYWNVGLAGMALYDYNISGTDLTSGPRDWLAMGENYTMVDDKMHPSYGRGVVTFAWDNGGHSLDGAYRNYCIVYESLYAHAYTYFYGVNFLDKYPLAKKHFMSEVWETFPNGYMSNDGTLGETRQKYLQWNIDLYDSKNQSYMASQIDRVSGPALLQYGSDDTGIGMAAIANYLMTMDISGIPRDEPSNNMLEPRSMLLVMRNGYGAEGSYVSLVQWNRYTNSTNSNRDLGHDDQLSIEYYDKGDLLIADGGEPKYLYNDADLMYGMGPEFHNVLLVKDASSTGSAFMGFYKGRNGYGGQYDNDLATPVTTQSIVNTSWMTLVDASLKGTIADTGKKLASPVTWERQLLYPEGDYLILVDRADSSRSWAYRSLFRPATNSITPTRSTSSIGHEDLALSIGDSPYGWQSAAYDQEISPGIASQVSWTATNLYGREVTTTLYSVPESKVVVNKLITRIGGYALSSNVYAPNVYLEQSSSSTNLYRVTAIMSNYSSEPRRVPATVAVAGSGNAMTVSGRDWTDYIYTGSGASSFAGFSTDADTVFVRVGDNLTEFTLINGKYLDYNGTPLVSLDARADYMTYRAVGSKTSFIIRSDSFMKVTVPITDSTASYRVDMDGARSTGWSIQSGGSSMAITATPGEHRYDLERL